MTDLRVQPPGEAFGTYGWQQTPHRRPLDRGHQASQNTLTSLPVVGDSQDEPQQTLGVLPLLQQHLGVAVQPQEEAERRQRVGGDGRHGLHRGGGGGGGGRLALQLLLVDGRGRGLRRDGLGRFVHQLPRLLDGHPLKLVAVLGLLQRGGGHDWRDHLRHHHHHHPGQSQGGWARRGGEAGGGQGGQVRRWHGLQGEWLLATTMLLFFPKVSTFHLVHTTIKPRAFDSVDQ